MYTAISFAQTPTTYRRPSPAIKGHSLVSIVSTIIIVVSVTYFHCITASSVESILTKTWKGLPAISLPFTVTVRSCRPLTRGVKVMV